MFFVRLNRKSHSEITWNVRSVSTSDLEQKSPYTILYTHQCVSKWIFICMSWRETEFCSFFMNSQVTAAVIDYSKCNFLCLIYTFFVPICIYQFDMLFRKHLTVAFKWSCDISFFVTVLVEVMKLALYWKMPSFPSQISPLKVVKIVKVILFSDYYWIPHLLQMGWFDVFFSYQSGSPIRISFYIINWIYGPWIWWTSLNYTA